MRILIAGCGDVGTHLGLRLHAMGHAVWGLRRNVDEMPPGISGVAADLGQADTLASLPPSLDLLYYTAAASGDRSEAGYRRAYVDGLRNILQACRRQGNHLTRVFFTSSTSVFGQTCGEPVSEESVTEPLGFSGAIMLEAEQVLLDEALSGTSVRFGGIYGPGRTYLIRTILDGTARLKENEGHYTNRIHRDDCAGFLAHLSEVANPEPLYLGVDSDPASYNEVLRFLAKKLNRPVPPVGDAARRDTMRGASNKRCSNRLLQASGYTLKYPSFREGYSQLIPRLSSRGA